MKFSRTLVIAVTGASLLVVPVLANAAPAPGTPVTPGTPNTPATSNGPAAPAPPEAPNSAAQTTPGTLGDLAAALNNPGAQVSALKGMPTVPVANIQLVDAAALAKGNNGPALDKAISSRTSDIASLRSTLQGVQVIDAANGNKTMSFSAALNNLSTANKLKAPVTIDRVVAVNASSSSGPLVVYYR
ncbi:MAG: hypothetical protein ABI186_02100 [Candidatus Elarobacter sp.]